MDKQTETPLTSTEQNGPAVVPVERARQGVTSGRVRYVLTISVFLVVVAFAIIYFAGLH